MSSQAIGQRFRVSRGGCWQCGSDCRSHLAEVLTFSQVPHNYEINASPSNKRLHPMNLPKRSKNRQALIDSGTYQPPKRKPMKRTKMRSRAKNNMGWIDVAEEIWNERKHVCEVCKVYIANPSPANFSHLLPRSTYPELKRDKRNIRIKCQKCHDLWHKHGPDALQWSTGWTKVCTLYFELYREAHGIQ